MSNLTNIRKNVMRRVYYAYSLSIVSHTMFWQGALLGASVALFGRLTHVASLVNNMLAVPIGSLPMYVSEAFRTAFQNGEVVTVVVTSAMFVLALSITIRLVPQFLPHRQLAAG